MNNNVTIGGSAFGPIANGSGARAIQRGVSISGVSISEVGSGADDGLAAALASLRDLVERHAPEIPEATKVRRDMATLETEAADPHRDPENMRDTIRRVVRRVGMAETVLTAANRVREMVEGLVS